jgi:murein DD-endopeptidase MepM/ murein hydrolase activator NlpD
MRTPALVLAALVAALMLAPPGAEGNGDGGAGAPGNARDGGSGYGLLAPKGSKRPAAGRPRARRPAGPVLESFRLEHDQLFLDGRPARVSFRLSGRRPAAVHLELRSSSGTTVVSRLDLGPRSPRTRHVVLFSGREHGSVPEGRYELRLAGRGLRRRSSASAGVPLRVLRHRFPLAGLFSYGDSGSQFGAARRGHSHRGQDLSAASGTRVLAPRGGVIESVGYQAAGAGHYVVVDGDGEDRDYVFMHLLGGSVTVAQGRRVRTGAIIGRVGSSGASTGPHLHFEIWVGGWYAGGRPIDPLPHLRRWEAAQGAAATRSRG